MTAKKTTSGRRPAKKSASKSTSSRKKEPPTASKSSKADKAEKTAEAMPATVVPGRVTEEITEGTGPNGAVLPVDKSGLHGIPHDAHNPAFAVDTSQ